MTSVNMPEEMFRRARMTQLLCTPCLFGCDGRGVQSACKADNAPPTAGHLWGTFQLMLHKLGSKRAKSRCRQAAKNNRKSASKYPHSSKACPI